MKKLHRRLQLPIPNYHLGTLGEGVEGAVTGFKANDYEVVLDALAPLNKCWSSGDVGFFCMH